MDPTNPIVEAVAVSADTIRFSGTRKETEKFIGTKTKSIDLKGQTMTPGFIEGHGHI
ncbi:MAG: hypothetical protein RL161_1286, partial [Bacteroidota bacterium]